MKRMCCYTAAAVLISPAIVAGFFYALLVYGPDLPDGWSLF